MKMENYSPSHPTDDMDIEISSKQDLDKTKVKHIQQDNDSSETEWKSLKSPVEDFVRTAASEMSVLGTQSKSPDKDNKSKLNKVSRFSRRSRSHSVDKRSISKSGYKRSRSRSKKRRSRSRNRRSHSRSRNKRSHSRSKNKRSDIRRSNSRSKNRRSRSKSNRRESRKDNYKPRGQERDSRRVKSRSKSPPRRPQPCQKDSNILVDRKAEVPRISRSPETHDVNDRSDDNIFSKLTELRTVPPSDSPKEKWGCDSDEEMAPKASMPTQSSFSDNRETSLTDNRGSSFQNNRVSSFSNNRGSFQDNRGSSIQDYRGSSFQDNRGRFGNGRQFGDRQDFGDYRGRGSFRGGQRSAPWGQGRFDNGSDRGGRNRPWEQNQPDFNRDNNNDNRNKSWDQNRSEPRGEQIQINPVEEAPMQSWAHNVSGEDLSKPVWEQERSPAKQVWGQERSPVKQVWGQEGQSVGSKGESKDNVDSEDEFSSWGKKDKEETMVVQSSTTMKREESKVDTSVDGSRPWGSDVKKSWADGRENKPWAKGAQHGSVRESTEGGFVAWKNAQRAEVMKQTETPVSNTVADNSDEEFGNWGKESKTGDNDDKVVVNVSVKKDSDDECGGWGGEKKGVTLSGNQRDQKKVSEDSDEEFGTWGSEQKATKSSVKEDFPSEIQHGDAFPHMDVRQNFQSRNNFNNSGNNNQFGQQRGGPRNFNNNQFQRPNNSDRPFNEQNNFNNCPPMASNDGGPQQIRPPFNYNQQHMPQWSASPQKMPNMSYQGGPMPFPIDTSVCPPMMSQMSKQGHPPPMQMMQQMPFIPPPPPNMSMHQMDMKGPSMGPGSMLSLMATMSQPSGVVPLMSLGQTSGGMMTGMGQLPSNMMPCMGQPPSNMGQPQSNMGQPLSNMGQHPSNMGQPPSNMGQHPSNMSQHPSNMGQPPSNMCMAPSNMGHPSSNMGHPPSNMLPGMNQSMAHMMSLRGPMMSNMPIMGASNSGQSMIDNSNLLETLMAKAGLSTDTLKMSQEKKQDSSKSVSDTFNTILKTAASSVISRFVESNQKAACPISDNMSMSPPSPPSNTPPPIRHSHKSASNPASFVPPPLPNYTDVIKQMGSKISNLPSNNIFASKSSDVDEEKRNRSDFDSKGEWQDRVAMEIKMFLKPAYMSRSIDKNDYKEIMKRCVTKIIRSGVTEINTDKIEKFVLSYVEKYNKNRKMKQHSAVSSSEHDLRCD